MAFLEKAFGFNPKEHKVGTEVVAGITTFLTMAYILAVNPSIFGALEGMGMPTDSVFTATALAALVATFVMAFLAKKPFGLAPGMGLNAFFVFTVCLTYGYSWQFALTAVFIEGIIFIILSATNVRTWILNSIPVSLKNAIGAGIGLFIAFIGLQNSHLVVDNASTLVGLGDICHGEGLLTVIGLVISSVLVMLHIRGGILIGILITAIIGIPMGITSFNGIVSAPPSIAPIFMQFEWHNIFSLDMLIIVFTFLFIDMFDTMGTVIGVSQKAGFVKEDGTIDGINNVFMSDAIGTVVGACFGTSTTTTYVESSAGVGAGGRTGLTAFSTACCFTIALFFAPVFLAIPSAATAPSLIIVGMMMMQPATKIEWTNYRESIPAFLTMLLMPCCYSISDGILIGMIAYVLMFALSGKIKQITPTMWVLAILFIARYIVMFSYTPSAM